MFFHLHECGTTTSDDEGQFVPDIEAAERIAVQAAREIMCGELAEGHLCLSCHVQIVDENGTQLMTVAFRDAVEITGYESPGCTPAGA